MPSLYTKIQDENDQCILRDMCADVILNNDIAAIGKIETMINNNGEYDPLIILMLYHIYYFIIPSADRVMFLNITALIEKDICKELLSSFISKHSKEFLTKEIIENNTITMLEKIFWYFGLYLLNGYSTISGITYQDFEELILNDNSLRLAIRSAVEQNFSKISDILLKILYLSFDNNLFMKNIDFFNKYLDIASLNFLKLILKSIAHGCAFRIKNQTENPSDICNCDLLADMDELHLV